MYEVLSYITCLGLLMMFFSENMKRRKLQQKMREENQPVDWDKLFMELGGNSVDPHARYLAATKVCETIKSMTAIERSALADYEAQAVKELRNYRDQLLSVPTIKNTVITNKKAV